jgi:lipopolysaccharide biosynthesis glycosyltransferase/exopolysaccharide biosynthesis predicted pyruvyltransferase EpsI
MQVLRRRQAAAASRRIVSGDRAVAASETLSSEEGSCGVSEALTPSLEFQKEDWLEDLWRELVVLVISCWPEHENHAHRYNFWHSVLGFPHVLLVVGRRPTDGTDAPLASYVVELDCDDRWQGLPGKVAAAFLHIQANPAYDSATQVLKVDDGLEFGASRMEVLGMARACVALQGYVGFKCFHSRGQDFRSTYHIGVTDDDSPWFGKVFRPTRQAPYWAGGRGYFVPKQTAALAAKECLRPDLEFIYEDAMVGQWMHERGVPMLEAPSVSPGQRAWCCDKASIRHVRNIHLFLRRLFGCDTVIFIPNPGNAGDSLIALGCFETLMAAGISFKVGSWNETYDNAKLVYAGAGNLVGQYPHCRTFLRRNMHRNNSILLLPATVCSEDEVVAAMGPNVTVMCREPQSYAYVYRTRKICKHQVWLAEDMAFYAKADVDRHRARVPTRGVLHCFRTCQQERPGYRLPADNIDLSFTLQRPNNTSDYDVVQATCADLFSAVSDYAEVWTNRLHVAIAAAMVGRTVHLFGSNYWKIQQIYEHSLRARYPDTVLWHDESPPWVAPSAAVSGHIVFCVDRKLWWALPTVLHTIAQHHADDELLFHLIHPDLQPAHEAALASVVHALFKRASIAFHRQTWDQSYRGADHITFATMLRLFIPTLLKDVKRAVYLDVDLAVCVPLWPLLSHPTNETGFAMRTSILASHWIVSSFGEGSSRRLGGNAGVLVMDLELLRHRSFTTWALEFLRSRGEGRITDQHVINEWCQGKHQPLARCWNVFNPQEPHAVPQLMNEGGCIVHYCGPQKPWDSEKGAALPNADLWLRKRITAVQFAGGR